MPPVCYLRSNDKTVEDKMIGNGWRTLGAAGLAFVLAAVPVLADAKAKPAPKLAAVQTAKGQYRHFRAAVYIPVNVVKSLADPKRFDHEFERAMRQVPFDKVYIEVYRDRSFATDAEIDTVVKAFKARGIAVAGGMTLAAGGFNGQFGTFDYEDPKDRAECQKAVETAARHFDEVIMDDFFFYTSKSDADIKAKGDRSWTQYRLDTMREVSKDLVLDPAHKTNPKVKVIIKYPNWYEHFQGLGYDLEKEPLMYDGLYTGTETRDPVITDQLLQQHESYEIIRYYSNIRPDHYNGGGWVDTYSTQYVDRYAEQLWDTLFAKAPEITLFNWHPAAQDTPVQVGDRSKWENLDTSFNWKQITAGYKASGANDPGPGWGLAAGAALKQADAVLGELGNPVGVASYKPFQSSGEDFLHNYLGNMGIPIELTPHFPKDADTILLTQAAAKDPDIINEIKGQLQAGKTVFVTSGFVRATQDKGFQDLLEVYATGQSVLLNDYYNGYGAGNGQSLRDDPKVAPKDILFPELHYFTNDAWPIIRGVSGARGFPVLLMNRYSKGILYVLSIPDNIGDLYSLPPGVMNQVKTYLQKGDPVRIDAPSGVSLFAYDNGAFIVESFRDEPARVTISLKGQGANLNDGDGKALTARPAAPQTGNFSGVSKDDPRTEFEVTIPPHSFRLYKRH
jgi:hypothetical protein